MRFVFVFVFGLVSLAAEKAFADEPDRGGFTVEVAPVGVVYVAEQEPLSREWHGAWGSVLGLGLGWYVSPRLGVLLRVAAWGYQRASDAPMAYGGDFIGVVTQYWPHERVFASAGVGAVNSGWAHLGGDDNGVGFSLRSGFSVVQTAHHSLRLSAEVVPALYGNDNAIVYGIVTEYQYW